MVKRKANDLFKEIAQQKLEFEMTTYSEMLIRQLEKEKLESATWQIL